MRNSNQKQLAAQRRFHFVAIDELRKAGFLRGKLDKLTQAEISMKISRRLLAEDSKNRIN